MNLPHYFMAVPLPRSLKEKFAGWQRELKPTLPYKNWVHPDDLHITLKFLGAVENEKLYALMESMKRIERLSAFSLMTGTLGTFGNPKKPRVLWVDVEQKRELFRLQQFVEEIALDIGFQQEKRSYSPHITLAKKWHGSMQNLSELKQGYTDRQTLSVNQIVLYQIHPGKNPKYAVTAIYHLSGEET